MTVPFPRSEWESLSPSASRGGPLPLLHHRVYLCANLPPSTLPVAVVKQPFIIVSVGVPDVGDYRQADCVRVKSLGRRRASDPAAMFAASMLGDLLLFAGWAAGVLSADGAGECLDVLAILNL